MCTLLAGAMPLLSANYLQFRANGMTASLKPYATKLKIVIVAYIAF
jgi:hypothetical protein